MGSDSHCELALLKNLCQNSDVGRVTTVRQKTLLVLGLVLGCGESLGGATRPQGPHSRLEEVSPLVEDIEIKKGDPYLEVFIGGLGHLDCYDVREFSVEKVEGETRIVPRLRRSDAHKPCKLGLKRFKDKAADLDPQNPASLKIAVLGFSGWHRREIDKAPTPQ